MPLIDDQGNAVQPPPATYSRTMSPSAVNEAYLQQKIIGGVILIGIAALILVAILVWSHRARLVDALIWVLVQIERLRRNMHATRSHLRKRVAARLDRP